MAYKTILIDKILDEVIKTPGNDESLDRYENRLGQHCICVHMFNDPLSTGMLLVNQQYHNAILDCQKQTNSVKLMTAEPPCKTNTKPLP